MTDRPKLQGFFSRKRLLALVVFVGVVGLASLVVFRRSLSGIFPFRFSQSTAAKTENVVDIHFDNPLALKDWREYSFGKKSEYKVEADPNGEMVLHASSQGGYSIIFKVVNIPLDAKPILAWEWRAAKFPTGKKHEKLDADKENDFPFRICAIFARNSPFFTEIVQYIWDDFFPEGTSSPGTYAKNVRMQVVQSGPPVSPNEWAVERQDLAVDYKKLFGKARYNELKAIAIVSNADDTQTEAEGYIKRIWIESAHPQKIRKSRLKIRVNLRKDIGNLANTFRVLAQKPGEVFKETSDNVKKIRLPKLPKIEIKKN